MTEQEREIFMKLLIDLFLDGHARERRKKKEQAAMQASSNAKIPADRAVGFSESLSITPLAAFAE
jgi:hypothetical protein